MFFSGLYGHMVIQLNCKIPVFSIVIFTNIEECSGDPD